MKCEDVRGLFSEYYDGETNQADEISLHLEGCADCNNEFEEFRSIFLHVSDIKETDVPVGFRQALVSYADGFYKGRKRHISITRHKFASAFASMAAAAAAVLVVWSIGIFDTGSVMYDDPQMFTEFATPQTAAGAFVEAFEVYDDLPRARFFDFDDETYDYVHDYPFAWHYMTTDEFSDEEITAFVIPETDDFIFFRSYFIETGYTGITTVIRPRFATAVVFLLIGIFLGFNTNRLAKYIERKSDNAL